MERFAVSAQADLVARNNGHSRHVDALTRDLSADGAFLCAAEAGVTVGDQVAVTIRLPVGRREPEAGDSAGVRFRGSGTVVRQEDDGVAVAFDRQLRVAGADRSEGET